MTDQAPDREVLSTAQDLTGALTEMAAEVKRLRRYGRTNRRFVLIDIAITLGVFLAGGIGIQAAQTANSASRNASSASAAQMALCQSSNVARQQQIGIWTFVIELSGPSKTAREAKIRTTFLAHLHQVYAKRDCASLGR